MMPINGVGQSDFGSSLANLMKTASAKAEAQQAAPQASATQQVFSETESANIAYGKAVDALDGGQQSTGQTGHALDPARVAALLDF